jgi:hypothetical protein
MRNLGNCDRTARKKMVPTDIRYHGTMSELGEVRKSSVMEYRGAMFHFPYTRSMVIETGQPDMAAGIGLPVR